ncbi:MAG: flavin monoamine oxidase family protein [Halopseudomonas aestusnigri]
MKSPFITRRGLLERAGRVGGLSATLTLSQVLGLLPSGCSVVSESNVSFEHGKGTSVVIIGAGIAGLISAYELKNAGYSVTVLEAKQSAGGRNLTIRGGDKITENGHEDQVCNFRDGLYFNAGPARIPSHHLTILDYCRKLGVKLETFIHANRNAYLQDNRAFDGKPVRSGQVINDTRGFIAENLSRSMKANNLDQEITINDQQNLLEFLKNFGNLDDYHRYMGSPRAGYQTLPGAAESKGIVNVPLNISELMTARFWTWKLHLEEEYNHQAVLLQPVGGMDRIVDAFVSHIGNDITYGAELVEITNDDQSTKVVYKDRYSGGFNEMEVDFCICTVPLPILAKIKTNFTTDYTQAIKSVPYMNVCRLAWQASNRFWEEQDHIYGGVSWTNQDIERLVYPSHDFQSDSGILIGAENHWKRAERFGNLSPLERARFAMSDGALIHPILPKFVSDPISIAWQNIPFAQGGWALWDEQSVKEILPILAAPQGRVFFAGEHLSHLPGWQEGAALSARHVVNNIHNQV